MLCREFKCVDELDNVCQVDVDNGVCVGDRCSNWGECINCQQLDQDECEGLKSL